MLEQAPRLLGAAGVLSARAITWNYSPTDPNSLADSQRRGRQPGRPSRSLATSATWRLRLPPERWHAAVNSR
jgi:hypothetical protein